MNQHQLDIRQCNIEREPLPFEDQSFSFVIFNEVFEHLRIDPLFTLSEINRVLKPDGLLMLATSNLHSLRNILRFVEGQGCNDMTKEFGKLRAIGHMGHVREYSTKELKKVLKNNGFAIRKVHYRQFKPHVIQKWSFGVLLTLLLTSKPFFHNREANQVIFARKISDIEWLSPLYL